MSRLSLLRALVLGCGACLLTQCHARESGTNTFPRSETLYIGGLQWGEPTSFNPLLSAPAWPVPGSDGTYNLLYEPLLSYNPDTGKLEPLLAESYTETEDEIEVVLNPAAHWSDGKPVTGYDVKYSFELGRTYKEIWKAEPALGVPSTRSSAPGRCRRRTGERTPARAPIRGTSSSCSAGERE